MRSTADPIFAIIALTYAYLLEGAVLTETVFAWPKWECISPTSLFATDMPAVLAATLVVGLMVVNIGAELINRHSIKDRCAMTLMTASLDWLRSDVPATRTQARLGAIGVSVGAWPQQPIGIAELMLLAIVIALAIGANWLPLADPLAQSPM